LTLMILTKKFVTKFMSFFVTTEIGGNKYETRKDLRRI
jgi:hypothetical protein